MTGTNPTPKRKTKEEILDSIIIFEIFPQSLRLLVDKLMEEYAQQEVEAYKESATIGTKFWRNIYATPPDNTIVSPSTPTAESTPRIPYKCPVCTGAGEVPYDFYRSEYIGGVMIAGTCTCRSCEGKGIIWSSEPAPPSVQEEIEQGIKNANLDKEMD